MKNETERYANAIWATNWIVAQCPLAIRFKLDSKTLGDIGYLISPLTVDSVKLMIPTYGIVLPLALIEYYKSSEAYEQCAIIVDAIQQTSKSINVPLPISIHAPEAVELLKMSVSDIIKNLK